MNKENETLMIQDILENFKNFILLNLEMDRVELIMKYLQEKIKNKKCGEIIAN
jgi:hypothetical protein